MGSYLILLLRKLLAASIKLRSSSRWVLEKDWTFEDTHTCFLPLLSPKSEKQIPTTPARVGTEMQRWSDLPQQKVTYKPGCSSPAPACCAMLFEQEHGHCLQNQKRLRICYFSVLGNTAKTQIPISIFLTTSPKYCWDLGFNQYCNGNTFASPRKSSIPFYKGQLAKVLKCERFLEIIIYLYYNTNFIGLYTATQTRHSHLHHTCRLNMCQTPIQT